MKNILAFTLPLLLISFGSIAEADKSVAGVIGETVKTVDRVLPGKPPRGAPAPLLGSALPAAAFAAAAYAAWLARSKRGQRAAGRSAPLAAET